MDIKISINITQDSKPCIRIRHFDKDDSIDQKLLGQLIQGIKDNGCRLVNTRGHIDTNGNSWEDYEIRINNKAQCNHEAIVIVTETPELRSDHEQLIGLAKTWVECEECGEILPISRVLTENRTPRTIQIIKDEE